MAHLLVRDVCEEMVRRLEDRAAAYGRSAEEEHRTILEQALRLVSKPPAVVAQRFQRETAESGPGSTGLIPEQREHRGELPEQERVTSRRDGWIPDPPQGRVRLC